MHPQIYNLSTVFVPVGTRTGVSGARFAPFVCSGRAKRIVLLYRAMVRLNVGGEGRVWAAIRQSLVSPLLLACAVRPAQPIEISLPLKQMATYF
jgi:hypothetical protein